MTAQTMSFRHKLRCKGFTTEKAQYLVTQQNYLCSFIGLTEFFKTIIYAVFRK